MYVCHTLHIAKAAGWNKMPFGRDTRVVPSNIVLDRGPGSYRRGDIWVGTPVRNDAAYRLITLALVFGNSRWKATKSMQSLQFDEKAVPCRRAPHRMQSQQ